MTEMVTLVSKDGEKIEVLKSIACKVGKINDIVEEMGIEDDILLPSVSGAALKKVVEFCNYIESNEVPKIPKPLQSAKLDIPEWFQTFLSVNNEELFDLILTCNDLNFQPLITLASAKVASLVFGKSVEEQRAFFNVQNDHSEEEIKQIQEEIEVAVENH